MSAAGASAVVVVIVDIAMVISRTQLAVNSYVVSDTRTGLTSEGSTTAAHSGEKT